MAVLAVAAVRAAADRAVAVQALKAMRVLAALARRARRFAPLRERQARQTAALVDKAALVARLERARVAALAFPALLPAAVAVVVGRAAVVVQVRAVRFE
jgi:hypothetical protein